MDWGFNCKSLEESKMYFNVGLLLRFGNYSDRIQFAFGLKPGFILYDKPYYYSGSKYGYEDYYGHESYESHASFHMPVVGQLKLNLFNTSASSRMFVYGQYQYNLVRQDAAESSMAASIGLGLAWKHFDCSIYYRFDLGDTYWLAEKEKFFGWSLIYYWQL